MVENNGEAMSDETVKAVPYGISDYGLIRRENYYYVDKTQYLKKIQKAGRYLFFIRPRRFGKSLFLSLMEVYYDVLFKDKFEQLFNGTQIYDNPTTERGTYLVLKFNFSMVDPGGERIEVSFLNHIQGRALSFLRKYANFLPKEKSYFQRKIEESHSASDILSIIIDLCRDSHQKLYVIIDEYDNFANTILSTSGEGAYEKLTHGTGFFRSFFSVLKGGTNGTGAPFSRLFLTGVSPITLDDVTSGYNIGENISLDSAFNRTLGFIDADVLEMLNYYKSAGLIKHDPGYLMEIIEGWYGNYLFSKYSNLNERLYNPDMVLYFLKEYFKTQSLPDDLIDLNVRIDYDKLRHLIIVDKGKIKTPNGNFSKLKEIIEKGETSSILEKGFPLEKLMDSKNFKSLLFYLGLLTIKGTEKDQVRLEIPNETVKRLYYDYIEEAYRETDIFDIDLSRYADMMSGMGYDGKWKPLFDYITSRMRESMSLRDLITGEKSIQAFLNVYLGLSNLYIIHAEKELYKGYADIVMEPFLARYEGIKYSCVLEIKYIKAGVKSSVAKIQQLKAEAEKQLKKYSMDEKLRKNIEKTTLIKLILIFSGHELIYLGEVS
jgi:hypothetical protein